MLRTFALLAIASLCFAGDNSEWEQWRAGVREWCAEVRDLPAPGDGETGRIWDDGDVRQVCSEAGFPRGAAASQSDQDQDINTCHVNCEGILCSTMRAVVRLLNEQADSYQIGAVMASGGCILRCVYCCVAAPAFQLQSVLLRRRARDFGDTYAPICIPD
jgi:hypothetical protein